MPKRKRSTNSGRNYPRNRNTFRTSAKFPGQDRPQFHESLGQSIWAVILWFCDNVVQFKEEPPPLDIEFMGEIFKYYPDFRVVLDDGRIVYVEVKPWALANKPLTKLKLERIRLHLESIGFEFVVCTEKNWPINTVAIHTLRRLKWFALNAGPKAEALEKLVPEEPLTLRELIAHLGNSAKAMEMIALQLLSFDLSKPLAPYTLLHKTQESDYVRFN